MRIHGFLLLLPVACAVKGASRPSPSDEIADADGGLVDSSSGLDSSSTSDSASAAGHRDGMDSPEGSSSSCAGLPLCDGFENEAPGTPPDPSLWTVLMGCNPNSPNVPPIGGLADGGLADGGLADGGLADGGLAVGIDGTVAHTGKNSLRIVGGDSCGYYAVNTSAFRALGASSQLYARFFARFSGAPTQNHNGFVSMISGTATNFLSAYSNSEQLRLGFQGHVIAWNDLSSDATLPDIDPAGEAESAATQPNAWDCIEFHIDPGTGHIEFWLNGTRVPGLNYDGGSTQGVSDDWHAGGPTSLSLKSFGLGWLGLSDQYVAWFDDVALSDSRIHCD